MNDYRFQTYLSKLSMYRGVYVCGFLIVSLPSVMVGKGKVVLLIPLLCSG